MAEPYREAAGPLLDDLAREKLATRALGAWRDRIRTAWIALFAIAGLVPAGCAFWFVSRYELDATGWLSLRTTVAAAAVVWFACIYAGRMVGNRVMRARIDSQVTALADRYEIPRERLAETAQLLSGI
jgi:hypothetical protein